MSNRISRSVRRRFSYLLVSCAVALGIGIGTPTPTPAAPLFDLLLRGVQLIQLSRVSPRQEAQIGQQINNQLLKQGMILYKDPGVNEYVDQVGQRLTATSDRKGISYNFQVVQDKNVNAFATTGGFVYVTTGLLQTADNEAQLASVMGHEIGHITSRHLIEQMRQTAVARGLTTAAGLDRNVAATLGVELALNRPRSRQDEFEADQAGLKLLRGANYAESAMPEFMKKLIKRSSSVPTFLSTHPAVPDRVTALEKSIQASPGNKCTQSSQATTCGLDSGAYQQAVRSRLAARGLTR